VTSRSLILVVDDDEAARLSLQALLEHSGYRVNTFSSGQACLDQLSIGAQCLITDIRMPGMDGLALQAEVARRDPALSVILVTGHGDVSLAVRGLKAGALDFIEKPFEAGAMLSCVARALTVGLAVGRQKAEEKQALDKLSLLTPRQRQVFDVLVLGQTTKEIARKLGASPRTIEVHRDAIMRKLETKSVAGLTQLSCAAVGPLVNNPVR